MSETTSTIATDEPVSVEGMLKALRSVTFAPKTLPRSGRVTILKGGEVVIDPFSGEIYCTQAGWDALKTLTTPSPSPSSISV